MSLVPKESFLSIKHRHLDGRLEFYEYGSLLQINIENHAHCFHIEKIEEQPKSKD